MVDFKKLRESKTQPTVIEPIEIFRRLPKPPGINDLYTSQAQVLEAWFGRRNEHDLVIKLHTGGGKTLVGLLIAQSVLSEHHEPVVYLSPTDPLVQQIFQKASEYSIPAVTYKKGVELPEDFISGKSVLICTYQALFNARSKFGVRGIGSSLEAAAIIFDDAHVAFSTVRDAFTLRIDRNTNSTDYEHLTNIFRNDFNALGKIGTFDDIVSGTDSAILEVPYWSWKVKSTQVRQFLRNSAENYPFVWSFLRDNFDYCHCLINQNAFIITPIFPLVDLIPTFADCPRRIFMSATISDDSAILRTFDANFESIAKPITSNSLAGVSERMILAPELMPFTDELPPQILKKLPELTTKKQALGTVILVPSSFAAKQWEDVAQVADSTNKVTAYVKQLVEGQSHGPFVFANRYDGIDLPGSACRLLILSGLPRGSSEYDQYRANTFAGGDELSSAVAQRIEQGMGRGARGSGDYCVVIVTGKDLTAWFGRSSNLKFLTKSTRAQFEMGVEVSKSITDSRDLEGTILRCFERDKDWIEYHAATLADLTEIDKEEDKNSLQQAAIERKAFNLMRSGYFEKAIDKLEKYCQEANKSGQQKQETNKSEQQKQEANKSGQQKQETNKSEQQKQEANKSGQQKQETNKSEQQKQEANKSGKQKQETNKSEQQKQETNKSEQQKLDQKSRGWLRQFAARMAYYWGKTDLAQQLQQSAYADNYNLLRPQVIPPYVPLTVPGEQAEAIVSKLASFFPLRGYLAYFDEVVSHLVPEASANQFEQALEDLGLILGFRTERPDNIYRVGPDVLWLLTDNLSLVIEAKSRKNQDNALTKEQHGQLLNAEVWFKQKYPNYNCIRVSVHPNPSATRATVTGQSKALTFNRLNQLIADTRTLLVSLCESVVSPEELVVRCEQLLSSSTLTPQALVDTYLVPFESELE
jgi:replicative superfamily II helicase